MSEEVREINELVKLALLVLVFATNGENNMMKSCGTRVMLKLAMAAALRNEDATFC